MARDVLYHAITLDSRTARSLGGLFRPGFLTAEYLAGRRQPYLAPVKLYIVCAAIFFLAAPLAGFTLEALTAREEMQWLDRLAAERMQRRQMDRALFTARFNLRLQTVYTALLGVSVVGAALMLALLFRRQRRPIGAHAIFALHSVPFLYLAAIGFGLLTGRIAPNPWLMVVLTYGVIGSYLVLGCGACTGRGSARYC